MAYQPILRLDRLLHLHYHVGKGIDIGYAGQDGSTNSLVLAIGKSAPYARSMLNGDSMPVTN